jgi:hypothetical protein
VLIMLLKYPSYSINLDVWTPWCDSYKLATAFEEEVLAAYIPSCRRLLLPKTFRTSSVFLTMLLAALEILSNGDTAVRGKEWIPREERA